MLLQIAVQRLHHTGWFVLKKNITINNTQSFFHFIILITNLDLLGFWGFGVLGFWVFVDY